MHQFHLCQIKSQSYLSKSAAQLTTLPSFRRVRFSTRKARASAEESPSYQDLKTLRDKLEEKLRQGLEFDYIAVDLEAKSSLRIVSREFDGMSFPMRQQLVLQALGDERLHADDVGMVFMTPAEAAASLKKWC
eukprot:jgi/Botrbrau1/18556/Bobra.0367s0007.1